MAQDKTAATVSNSFTGEELEAEASALIDELKLELSVEEVLADAALAEMVKVSLERKRRLEAARAIVAERLGIEEPDDGEDVPDNVTRLPSSFMTIVVNNDRSAEELPAVEPTSADEPWPEEVSDELTSAEEPAAEAPSAPPKAESGFTPAKKVGFVSLPGSKRRSKRPWQETKPTERKSHGRWDLADLARKEADRLGLGSWVVGDEEVDTFFGSTLVAIAITLRDEISVGKARGLYPKVERLWKVMGHRPERLTKIQMNPRVVDAVRFKMVESVEFAALFCEEPAPAKKSGGTTPEARLIKEAVEVLVSRGVEEPAARGRVAGVLGNMKSSDFEVRWETLSSIRDQLVAAASAKTSNKRVRREPSSSKEEEGGENQTLSQKERRRRARQAAKQKGSSSK